MADIQGSSLYYFIYMRIAHASSVSTTCIDHHIFMILTTISTSLECDAGFKNNIGEMGFIFQLDLKSL